MASDASSTHARTLTAAATRMHSRRNLAYGDEKGEHRHVAASLALPGDSCLNCRQTIAIEFAEPP